MRIPILLFMIASIILLSVHFWANWDSYLFHPEEDDFHPEEPAAEFLKEEHVEE